MFLHETLVGYQLLNLVRLSPGDDGHLHDNLKAVLLEPADRWEPCRDGA